MSYWYICGGGNERSLSHVSDQLTVYPRDGVHESDKLIERVGACGGLLRDLFDGLVQKVDVAQDMFEHKTVMRLKAASKGLPQFGKLLPKPSLCQICQRVEIGAAAKERFQHHSPGHPHHVGRHDENLIFADCRSLWRRFVSRTCSSMSDLRYRVK